MGTKATLCLLGMACALSACNQPAVTLKPPAFQSSENTVRDWNDVAHKIADGMAGIGLLPAIGQPASPNPPAQRAIYIRVQGPDSAFLQQVADQLEADILARRGFVSRTPDGATVVNLDVNVVRWGPRDKPPGLVGTTAGILAIPGIVIGDSLPMSTWTAANAGAFTAVGVGALLDTAVALTPTMNAEAIWKATIVSDGAVVMQMGEPVYIRGPDIPLYMKTTSLSPMPSWSAQPTLRVRTIRFDP